MKKVLLRTAFCGMILLISAIDVSAQEAGTDYIDMQFIARFLDGYVLLPQGHTEAYLSECRVNLALRSMLEAYHVNYVKQVFKGYQHGDTLRIVNNETIRVPISRRSMYFIRLSMAFITSPPTV